MGNCCHFHTPPSPPPPPQEAPSQPPPSQSSPPPNTLVATFDESRLQELGMVMNLRETLLGFIKHGRMLVDEVVSCVAEEGKEKENTGTTTNSSSTPATSATATAATAVSTTTTLLAETNKTAKAAHALKGAAKTVGALRLATCAEAVERQAKQGLPCADLLPALLEAFDDLATATSRRSTW